MKNFTKCLKFCLLFLSMIFWTNVHSQSSILESFDSGTPSGWTDTYANTTSQVCAGNSERDNIFTSTGGSMTTVNQVGISNGTDITFSIDYKVVDWSAATVPTSPGWGSADLQYSTDDGATWITVGTIDDSNNHGTNVCATYGVTIAGADVPVGSDLKFKIDNTYGAGDYYFYIDNFVATQVSANPPNCDAALASDLTDFPIDGTLTWSGASGIPTGYKISVGSSSGGTDIANNVDVMAATSYALMGLMNSTTYYVTIVPYNDNGDAMGCTEQTFETIAPPPANDECMNALPLTESANDGSCANTVSGTTNVASQSPESSLCTTFSNDDDVWYTLTAAETQVYNFELTNTTSNTYVHVYSGDCAGGLTSVGSCFSSNDNSASLTAGTTYYVQVHTSSSSITSDFDLCAYPIPDPNQTFTVDCAASGTNTTHCYAANDLATFTYTAGDGSSGLEITFNAGTMESCCDDIMIYDGMDATGALLYSGNNGGDLTGLVVAGGTSVHIVIDSDGSVQCDGSSTYTPWDWDVACVACVSPTASGSDVTSCPSTDVAIDVVIADLGSASSLIISNSLNATTVPATAVGTLSVPGFMIGDGTVTITVTDASDPTCFSTFDVNITETCPPACGGKFYDTGGPFGDYDSGENESWTICPDNAGEFVTVTFNMFETEGRGVNNCWDALRIYDGNSASAPEIGPGPGYCYESATDGTNYPGIVLGTPITSTDASGCLHFVFTSDGSGERDGWDADVTCGPASSSCGDDAVILAGAAQTDLTPQCMEGGWLYYGDGSNTYFAIEPFPAGGNTDAFTANVDIFLGAAQLNNAAVCNGAPIDAYFEMGRAWNVDVLTGAIGGTVNCRFYYDAAELTALTTAVSTFESANSACTYSSGAEVWFKNTGVPYVHYSYDGTQATLATTPGTNGMGVDYREFPVTGFSGGSVGITSLPLTVLPVELASFTGKTMAKTNMLEWVTASEENTEWHVIERSKDGRSDWSEVGRTEAKGFSSQLISYELEDEKPMAKSYYRLRSIDFDGHVDISDVIYLERQVEQFDIVNVYPVPTSKLLNIDFETIEDQQIDITLTDMLGKVISTRPVNSVAGMNTATLEMGNLVNGIYFVTINNGQNKITKRVVKN